MALRISSLIVSVLLILGFGSVGGRAQEASKTLSLSNAALPDRDEPLIIGVGVHFGIGGEYGYSAPKTAELIKTLGLDSFRDDVSWSSFFMPSSGLSGRQPAKLFDFMDITSAKPVLILGHPNPNFPGGNPPLAPGGRNGFSNFATRAVMATRQSNPIYEIWNEWNMNAVRGRPFLMGPGDESDPRAAVNYAPLAKQALQEIAQVEPKAKILVGAVGIDNGWKWTQAAVQMGILKGASGLSVHMYNHCERNTLDRTAREAIDRLYDLQKMLKSTGITKDFPIYITEFGWPTATKQCVISRQTAADNISQFLLWSAATPWLKGAWVYQMKDQGTNPAELEDNFGLYDYNYAPKPASCAVGEAVKAIRGAKSLQLQRPFDDVFVLNTATKDDTFRIIAWTSRAPLQARLVVPQDRVIRAASLCSDAAMSPNDIRIGPTPVIIDLKSAASVVNLQISLDR